jgi:hypothetical protein
MGIFADWQPRYAEYGIATFPLNGKKPAVERYQKLGLDGSQQLTFRFPDHDALGFICGPRNAITVLDVDTSDERVLADALARHGATPLVVRSGSGNYQAYYRHGGERRQIRPWGKDVPIDVLGGGQAVGVPSIGLRGRCEFLQGCLSDIPHLPPMGGLPTDVYEVPARQRAERMPSTLATICEGERNDTLWRECMRFARSFNSGRLVPPLDDAEVVKTARSAWRYTVLGKNRFGADAESTFMKRLAIHPEAVTLLVILEMHHADKEQFALANSMAKSLEWGLPRWRAARDRLVEEGLIRCISPGGRWGHDPPIYGWT